MSLQLKAVNGMLWTVIEKISIQVVQFIIGIVLARLLMPSDYGLVGMLSIFIAISQWLMDSGFTTALMQKRDRSDIDFSTVFYFNLFISVIFYIILFVSSGIIADFYSQPELALITKVLAINLIVGSFCIVQNTKLTVDLNFKSITIANVVAVILSGSVGIVMAYNGFGVWALVWQSVCRALTLTIIIWKVSEWKPGFEFSFESFRTLFNFGSKVLAAGMISTVFRNIYSVLIGKVFDPNELGFFTRAQGFTDLTSQTITSVVSKVSFPILAEMQNDKERLVSTYRRLVRMTSFFVFPTMSLLAIIAEPFIRVLLTDKWMGVVPLLQLLCLARVFTPISTLNMNILNVVGRSDLFLKIDMIKIPLIILSLLITLSLGVKAVVIGHVVVSVLSYGINTYYPSKFYQYGLINQLKDIRAILFATLIMSIVVAIVGIHIEYNLLRIVVSVILGGLVYLFISYLLKTSEFNELKAFISKWKRG
jgi:O-antigen/teichoic acid export membrane protein